MNNELLPCPFCDASNLAMITEPQITSVTYEASYVECLDCDARGPKAAFRNDASKESAIILWNSAERENFECGEGE